MKVKKTDQFLSIVNIGYKQIQSKETIQETPDFLTANIQIIFKLMVSKRFHSLNKKRNYDNKALF